MKLLFLGTHPFLPVAFWLWFQFLHVEEQLVDVRLVELADTVAILVLHLAQLLLSVGHLEVRVDLLLPLLHHLKLGVHDLDYSIEDHMVVEVELIVKIMLFLKLLELLGRPLNIDQPALERQMSVLDDFVDE